MGAELLTSYKILLVITAVAVAIPALMLLYGLLSVFSDD